MLEFFKMVATWTIQDIQEQDLMGSERQVCAQIVIKATLPNGAILHDEEMHLWTFNQAGKVSAFRHYSDTGKHIAAARGG